VQLSDSSFDLSRELLDSINDHDIAPTFDACINAHGMYETMRFVLRLSPRNHELMEIIEGNQFDPESLSPEAVQAYSTYIHETVHWWQHVGSTSGLLFSLSYLAQTHSTMRELREVLEVFGPKKPLKAWADQILLAEGAGAQEKLAAANVAVNNALDVEYYKAYSYSPRENIKWMIEQNHFESVGYTYTVGWNEKILHLKSEEVVGYYWRSPVHLPAVGMRAIYEGQARFIQLQFLDGAWKEALTTADWRDRGFLSGIYVEAFEAFLRLSESEWPESISDPLVGLFLLICDLAINPTRGVPLEIESFEDFILDVVVGVRFTRLCLATKELAHLKKAICKYTRQEYIEVSTELTQLTGYDHPLTGCWAVKQWYKTAPGLNRLMEEYKTFDFEGTNLPIRVFVSHFVAFCTDKYDVREIWLRHLSLFSDRGDKDGVYPRRWPNRSEAAVKQTFQSFYSNMALYDLTRQWILKDGPFVCDYRWLFESYNQDRANAWVNETMQKIYNVTLEDFEIIQ